MKKKLRITALSLTIAIASVLNANSQGLRAYMQNSGFLSLQSDTPYAETYLSVPGNSIVYKKGSNGKYEGALEITLLYLQDSSTVAAYDKYVLRSPELEDTANITFNMLDIRRVSLPDDIYNVHLEVRDIHGTELSPLILTQALNLHFRRDSIDFSNIELIDSYAPTTEKNIFSKNGYDIKPYVYNYYPTSVNKVSFYNEIYNLDKIVMDEDVIITYSIRHAKKNQVANDLFRFTKQKAAPVNIVFSEFDITDLPSGNYILQVQVKNRKNVLIGEQNLFFQRSNKNSIGEFSNIGLLDISRTFVMSIDEDSLVYFIKSLTPAAELYERDYITLVLQMKDTMLMRQFFYNFWQKRNATEPETEWAYYKRMVAYAEYNYRTAIAYGFETDRGRVYLQYGPPNDINGEEREPGAYPYEIWHYYKLLNNQSNIVFVFCNSDLVTNDYELIHSNALGELNDPRWRFKIFNTFKDGNGYRNFDVENFRSTWGSQVDEYFKR